MHAPANCQPFGRSDRPVAALSAVAICDATSIGFLRQSLKGSPAGVVFDRSAVKSQGAESAETLSLQSEHSFIRTDGPVSQCRMRSSNRQRAAQGRIPLAFAASFGISGSPSSVVDED